MTVDGDDNAKEVKKKAVVVGGGPVGLATALTLSNAPHLYDVTLLEEAPKAAGYDPSKAYLYLVNPRGQEWTKRFPEVQRRLVERGSENSGMGNFMVVPANPADAIPDKVPFNNGTEPSYWIPRHSMVTLLEEVIEEQEAKRQNQNLEIGSIRVLPNQGCLSLTALDDGRVNVTAMDKADPEIRFERIFTGDLIVGADGMNSAVRNCLGDDTDPKATWLTMDHENFQVRYWKSPSSGLRMKILQLPPGFQIPVNDGTESIQTENEVIYVIRSVNKGPKDYISLGLLPVKDPNMVRPTNVVTRPNHDVWKIKSPKEMKIWFRKAFPRLNLEELISDAEWERFTSAQGTIFPKCQYCPGLQVSHPDGNTGVVLVGDAIHAFPPDIGQGINAGLGDVEALDRALKGKDIISGAEQSKKPPNLKEALEEYQRVRGPEIRSLIRLARFGSPYQYKQPLYKDRVGRFLWTANVAMRLLLNKVSFGLIPTASIMSAMDKNVTYRKLMRRADITTIALWSAVALLFWKVCLSALVRSLPGMLPV